MAISALPRSQDICQKLLRGYQFSASDLSSSENSVLYTLLKKHFKQFQDVLAMIGYRLKEDNDVLLLENEHKALSNEEKQTVVVLFLLVDLWLEKGKPYPDLFQLSVPWRDLDWFRDGYGKEYLAQVGIEVADGGAIEKLFRRIARKGLLEYHTETSTLRLRDPAERILNEARHIHAQMQQQSEPINE